MGEHGERWGREGYAGGNLAGSKVPPRPPSKDFYAYYFASTPKFSAQPLVTMGFYGHAQVHTLYSVRHTRVCSALSLVIKSFAEHSRQARG
jgi:hypothetical protein